MSAANTDNFLNGVRKRAGNLDSSGIANASVDNFGFDSASGLPTDTALSITIDRVDANGNKTPDKEEEIIGVVSGDRLINCVRGVSGTAQAHAAGAVWEVRLTAAQWNRMIAGMLAEHGQDGKHGQGFHALTGKTTPDDTDEVSIIDSAASWVMKKLTMLNLKLYIMSAINPVGTIREFNVATNPATLLGFGTWSAFGTGRVTVAIDAGQSEFDTNGETGGEKVHTLSVAEIPAHDHGAASFASSAHTHSPQAGSSGWASGGTPMTGPSASASIPSQGGGGAHNNLQPYIVVYRWVRTA